MTNNSIFTTKDLSVGYRQDAPILTGVNLNIGYGEICALLGPNGSGKSTFIKTIADLLEPLSGNYILSKGTNISMVPQAKKFNLNYPLTVTDMLSLPKQAQKFFCHKSTFSEWQKELLEKIGILGFEKNLLRECSGGQLQKVLIARSLLSGADLIFMDEPMDTLDRDSQETIFSILKDYVSPKNKTLFIITHNSFSDWLSNFHRSFQINGSVIEEH
jgi:ABC-type Mn2+/Zn2+ transport system ATPase subunit